MTRERLYKITGTGWFFHDFYIMATSEEFARARAYDVIFAEHRARSGLFARKSAKDQVVSVKLTRDFVQVKAV